jgi:hypothetical protein
VPVLQDGSSALGCLFQTPETQMTAIEFTAYTVKHTENAKQWLDWAMKAESKEEFLFKISEVKRSIHVLAAKAKQEHSSRAFGSGD